MKPHYCFWCGEELPASIFHDAYSTCGKPQCERGAAEKELQDREEAHDELDRLRGWK